MWLTSPTFEWAPLGLFYFSPYIYIFHIFNNANGSHHLVMWVPEPKLVHSRSHWRTTFGTQTQTRTTNRYANFCKCTWFIMRRSLYKCYRGWSGDQHFCILCSNIVEIVDNLHIKGCVYSRFMLCRALRGCSHIEVNS